MDFVKIKGFSKNYGVTKVFEKIEINIRKGEFITLLGPSGCGKSTLLRCIAGLTDVTSGSIVVDGEDITKKAPRNRNIGMVFQNYALFPNLTVEENIAFGLEIKKDKDIKNKVERIIEVTDLKGKEKRYPHEISGGQKQRVALARALIMKPKILLLDEPLSALDAVIRKSLREKIREIQKEFGITTIFVTHDQEEALTISDRIFIMNEGKFSQIGTPEEIYTHPANEFMARFMGNYNIFENQDIKNVFDEKITGEVLAIRPESIYIREAGRNYDESKFISLDAQIIDFMILGNVIRYKVKRNQAKFTVDLLNRGENKLYEAGKTIELMFMKSEIKIFEKELKK